MMNNILSICLHIKHSDSEIFFNRDIRSGRPDMPEKIGNHIKHICEELEVPFIFKGFL